MPEPTSRRQWLTHMSALTVVGLAGERGLFPADATPLDRVLGSPWGTGTDTVANGVVRMDRNENPYGPSARTVAAMSAALAESHRYAHEERTALTQKLAKMDNLPDDHVLVGDGSTEPMGLLAAALFRDGGQVLSADRTFGVLQRNIERLGGKWRKVPLDSGMRQDFEGLARAITTDTKVVYFCNPNNPTGTLVAPDVVKAACAEMSTRVLVVVDEAYTDYVDPAQRPDLASLVREGANVCILRTFSKIHALAGMRVGYALAQPALLAQMRRNEWGTQMTNRAGLVGAITSLDDTANVLENRRRNATVMASTQAMLKGLGFAPYPSVANHLWFGLTRPAAGFKEALMGAGYAVVASTEKDGEWCRLTLGTPAQMAGFEKVLRSIV
jgi:histidinol-phosphate aminotransferase